ncbi:hypothetical protein [Variovorax rhizosphaerae]|uniref:Glycosyltransferase RgtA/B/C/D-like domain-containing protein n=1 Tax=Variovorax rhizosphaerae TaxID=1836200 RepID=A0ABU8WHU7_9BURK
MNRSIPSALYVLLGFCLFHIVGVMSYVLRVGRLSSVPIYDDVYYLNDGQTRLELLDRVGIFRCLADFFIFNPPHAPFTALTGLFGLMLSAGADWGPYVLSSGWLLFVVLLGWLALRELEPWKRSGVLVSLLAVPLFGTVLSEFRPDPVWGLMVGFTALLLVSANIVQMKASRLFALGLLVGASIIAKPTAAPAAALMLAAGLAVSLCLRVWVQSPRSPRAAMRAVAVLSLGAACVLLPYLLTGGPAILAQIRDVMAPGSVWRTQTSAWGHISYYLNKGAGTPVLGWVWYASVPLFVLSLTWAALTKDAKALCTMAGLAAATLTAYLIVTLSPVKSPMVGSFLYGAIIASSTWCLAFIVMRSRVRGRIALLIGALVFITCWVPRSAVNRNDSSIASINEATYAVLPQVLDAMRAKPGGSALVTAPGPVYSGTVEFMSRRQGIEWKIIGAPWETWEPFEQSISSMDLIILAEAGMVGQSLGYDFPGVRLQGRLLDTLRARADFKGRPLYTDKNLRSVWMFVRNGAQQ